MSTITITSPSNPPACLTRPLVACSVTINWMVFTGGGGAPAPVPAGELYKVTFLLYDGSGNQIGGSPIDFPVTTNDYYATVPFNVGADVMGATFVAKLMKSTDNGVSYSQIARSSTSPYDLMLTCPVKPTNPRPGDGFVTTAAGAVAAPLMRSYDTPYLPAARFRYVYAVVERFNESGPVKTFTRIEHVEFADYYPPQGIPNTPRYQAEVPYFVKDFDPDTTYYVYFMFVNSAGTIVDATTKYKMV
jgi:hypothetical protein